MLTQIFHTYSNNTLISNFYLHFFEQEEPSNLENKDLYNLSNDEYYNPRLATDNALRTNLGGVIQVYSILYNPTVRGSTLVV